MAGGLPCVTPTVVGKNLNAGARVNDVVGYTQTELDDVQAKWDIRFPPDLVDLLRERRPLVDDPKCFDWVTADPKFIRERLDWPFESYWRSVERNEFWWPEWGERAASTVDRKEKLRGIFAAAPKLIPLVHICYLPNEPNNRGNPVLSVMASDIIYVGADLGHWIEHQYESLIATSPPIKEIRFWGQAIRYGEDPSSVVRRQMAASFARRKRGGA
jgi:hypothetical protein